MTTKKPARRSGPRLKRSDFLDAETYAEAFYHFGFGYEDIEAARCLPGPRGEIMRAVYGHSQRDFDAEFAEAERQEKLARPDVFLEKAGRRRRKTGKPKNKGVAQGRTKAKAKTKTKAKPKKK